MLTAVKEAQRFLSGRVLQPDRRDSMRVPELCRQKLLHYAESFEELARYLEADDGPQNAARAQELAEHESRTEEQQETGTDGQENGTDRQDMLEQRRTLENRMMIGHNLYEMSQIMTQLADELLQCRPMEERYQKMIRHALRAESIYADHFCYLTDRDDSRTICMTIYTDREDICPASAAADMLSVLLRRRLKLSAASPVRIEAEPHCFVFVEEPRYVMLTGFCKVKKEDEQLSGDHYSILESEKGRMTLLLSDGTGSGEEASRDSEKALDLMEKFLEAGYDPYAAADMVNVAFYVEERDISHPTLDLCELDLYDGVCRFLKVGGAVSYIRHGRTVESVRQSSLPLGIFRNLERAHTECTLGDGDQVILMTDGVLAAFPQENAEEILEETIADMQEIGPGEIAEKIIETALHACGGHVKDDMTVLVAGVWENT
ncbi:MAG: SpoIIE family protein phosphatase [Lachnospiraceae bacterium]|nr:SpoIIE family protein phosphatase [Lachnospiraceae bacterium]